MTSHLLACVGSAVRFALAACGLIIIAACSSAPRTRDAAPAQQRIAYQVTGRGAPVVVLQSGLGDGSAPWRQVSARLQAHATVFSYDRPGYGASPSSSAERDPCSIAREQRALLASAGQKPPYILVGHSLGGLYQFAYAKLYPDEVAGLVLLDPTHPRHWEQLQARDPLIANLIKGARATQFTPVMRREFDAQSACLDTLDLNQPLALPVRLLTRGEYDLMERGKFKEIVTQLSADWARLTGARVEIVAGSGHYLQKDRPHAVADAIVQLSAARGR
jgi:pimeloyl-ACP methyl ester carboxylesterase